MGIDDLVEPHLKSLRSLGRSKRTLEGRAETLLRADMAPEFPYGLDGANYQMIEAFLGREGWRANTRCAYYSHLKGFYAWAVKAGILAFNPMVDMPRPRKEQGVPDPVTDEELRHILTNANDQVYYLSLLAAGAGLRCCEIAQLLREDITNDRVWVRRGKGGKAGLVETNAALWVAFEPFDLGSIVGQLGGKPEDPSWVSNLGVRKFKALGLRRVHFHRLRHWYVTAVYKHRRDLLAASTAARHSSVSTTQGYTLLDDRDRRAAIAALPVIGGVPVRRPAG